MIKREASIVNIGTDCILCSVRILISAFCHCLAGNYGKGGRQQSRRCIWHSRASRVRSTTRLVEVLSQYCANIALQQHTLYFQNRKKNLLVTKKVVGSKAYKERESSNNTQKATK